MSISLFFGLPGVGKTTMCCYLAKKFVCNPSVKNVYTNVRMTVPGVTVIDNTCIGRFDLRDGVLIIDEGLLFADNRNYKNFSQDLLQFFVLARHYNLDIFIFSQQVDGLDKKIRVITDKVFYVYKGKILGKWFTRMYRIPYGIIIPNPKKDGSEKLGEIVQGYCKPSFLIRIFSPWIFRPKYYKYFDSWEAPELSPLPERYKKVGD